MGAAARVLWQGLDNLVTHAQVAQAMGDIPRDSRLDNTLALLTEGWRFIRNGCARHHSEIFEARILLQPTVCMSRGQAAELLDDDRHLAHFAQEILPFYPSFPFVAARVRREFTWKGYHFPEGRRVLLDLYTH